MSIFYCDISNKLEMEIMSSGHRKIEKNPLKTNHPTLLSKNVD